MTYQLVGEDEHTFRVNGPSGEFTIAKEMVGPEVHKRIKGLEPIKMAEGGEVPEFTDTAPQLSAADMVPTQDAAVLPASLVSPMAAKEQPKSLMESLGLGTFKQDPYGLQPTAPAPASAAPTTEGGLNSVAQPMPTAVTLPEQAAPVLDPGMAAQNTALDAQQKSLGQTSAAVQKEFQSQAKVAQDLAKSLAAADAAVQAQTAPLQKENDALFQAIKDDKIDPTRLMGHMSTGNKILAAISVALSGIGAGLSGKENMAMGVLQKAIDRDIEAQRADLGKKQTLFSENLRRLGDARAAAAVTKSQLLTVAQAMMGASAARIGSAQAQGNHDLMSAQIELQRAQLTQKAAVQVLAQRGGELDPAVFVPRLVPEHHQEAVYKEVERAQNTRRMGASILAAFDQAAKENTALRTGGGMLRTPASVLALHQAMQPTFQDLEGTVRQAAMDNTFKNVTPMPGDMGGTVATKRTALEEYLRSKASAPRAKSFGINLDNFGSSTTHQEQTKTMGGVRYRKVNGGWQRAQ